MIQEIIDMATNGHQDKQSDNNTMDKHQADSDSDSNANNESQSGDDSSQKKGMNSVLGRALIGGLVGATVTTLAGALASKRTSQGVKHSLKGIKGAAKTVGEGLSQSGKGLGDGAKSVAEGIG
ncbi:MAG: hypothetical protein WBA41_15710, partial [Rivularia sp. (in: cyanobacteria)]